MSPVVSNVSGKFGIDSMIKAGVKQPGGKNLQQKLIGDVANILNTQIEFVPAAVPYESATAALKAKYIRIGGGAKLSPNGVAKKSSQLISTGNSIESRIGQDQIPPAKVVIFQSIRIKLAWAKRYGIGLGLRNQGNTCFLNSILQAITYTPPLVNFLISDHVRERCPLVQSGFCSLCELRGHISRALTSRNNNESAISPSICNKMKVVMKSYSYGRQEDAHEFLRYLIDSMQNASLAPYKNQKLDMWSKQTTPICRIFGGFHKNEIICLICSSKSVTFDPFLDVSLEIKGDSVEKCLQHFTRVETLQSENAYQCGKCKTKTAARKCYSIHSPPNILTLQLKRFSNFGKVSKPVEFPEKLNLRPFMSTKEGSPVFYNLYAVVVHAGGSMTSGHYFSFVRDPESPAWHLMDDSRVTSVSLKQVLSTQAYLLFYSKVDLATSASEENSNGRQSVGQSGVIKGVILNSDERHIGASISGSTPTKTPPIKTFSMGFGSTSGLVKKISVVPKAKQPEVIRVEIRPKISPAKLIGPTAPKLVPYEDDDESSGKDVGVDDEFPLKKSAEETVAPVQSGWESIPTVKTAQPISFVPPILLKKQNQQRANLTAIKIVPKTNLSVKVELPEGKIAEKPAEPIVFAKPSEVDKSARVYRERKLSESESSSSDRDKERKSREKDRRDATQHRHKSSSDRHRHDSAEGSESRRKRKLTPTDNSSSDSRDGKEKKRHRHDDSTKDKKKKKKHRRRERSRSPSRHSSTSSGSARQTVDKPKWNTTDSEAMVVEREESSLPEKKISTPVEPISIGNRFSVLEELSKGSCNAGLGPSVTSWSDDKVKVESNRHHSSEYKSDSDEEEVEQRREKRRKAHRHGGSGNSNLFEKIQEERRRDRHY